MLEEAVAFLLIWLIAGMLSYLFGAESRFRAVIDGFVVAIVCVVAWELVGGLRA